MSDDAIRFFELIGERFGQAFARGLHSGTPRASAPQASARRPRAQKGPRRAGPGGGRSAPAPAKDVKVGAQVRYRQGRGTFPAEVVRVDELARVATLQRISDSKRVLRPFAKIFA